MKQQALNFLESEADAKVIGWWKHEIPKLACWIVNDCQVAFYCRYCFKVHLHGIGNGHRVAHCTNQKSPFKQQGYYLVCQGDLTLTKSLKEKIS